MKDKKLRAISPVIATLLLIIVAVIAGVALYTFASGFIAQTTAQSKAPSSIVIDAASLTTTGTPSVTLYVRNVGQVAANVTAIYVLNATDLSVVRYAAGLKYTIPPGTVTQVGPTQLTQPTGTTTTITKGAWYIVQVVTAEGSSASVRVRAS